MTGARSFILLALLLCTSAGDASPLPVAAQSQLSPGQETRQTDPPPTDLRAETTRKLEEAKAELESARAALKAVADAGSDIARRLNEKVNLLTKLDLLYGQILAALDHANELGLLKTQLGDDLQKLRSVGPAESRPFRFSLLESLRDQAETESSRASSRAEVISAAEESLARAKLQFESVEKNRRKAKELLDSNTVESLKPALATALQDARLASRVANAEKQLREVELANQRLEDEVRKLQLAFLQEKIVLVAKDVRFTQEGLDERLARIDQEELRLKQELDLAQADFSIRDTEWLDARRRLEASPVKEPALVEEFDARTLARRSKQREVSLLGEQLQALADCRKAWNRRFAIFNETVQAPTVREWGNENRQVLAQLDRDIRINSARITEIRKDEATIEGRIQGSAELEPDVKRWLQRQAQHLNSMLGVYRGTVDRLESTRKLHGKLQNEIAEQVATTTWSERIDYAWNGIVAVWNYELTSIQDSPITVRKIVIGIVLLVVGIFLCRRVVDWIARRFLPRFGLNEGAVAAIQSLLFYLLLLTVVMISLRIVNVPLTAFTILGGALAIGIGFGSQNIVNNFISGLILLAERPIRVGDLVQLDDLVGIVEHIGPRSTRVRSPENVDIIVPNSSFLENNVINWTLTDDRYRAKISVGVVYGSPSREVIRLIRKAIDEHGRILPKPEPIILFEDFGDNALIFEAHFWVRMRRIMDRRLIQSDVRSRIDSLFREAAIVVAFPQRDVHLDANKPIPVQIVEQNESAGNRDSDATSQGEPPAGEEHEGS